MNPANVRLLQQLRADLFHPHDTSLEQPTDLPETATAVAKHHRSGTRARCLHFHQRWDATHRCSPSTDPTRCPDSNAPCGVIEGRVANYLSDAGLATAA